MFHYQKPQTPREPSAMQWDAQARMIKANLDGEWLSAMTVLGEIERQRAANARASIRLSKLGPWGRR